MNHHPDIDLLIKYASGNLEPALGVAIGIHVLECLECRRIIDELESFGGETLQSNPGEINDTKEFDKLMAEIELLPDEKPLSDYDDSAVADVDRAILKQLKERNFAKLEWKKVSNKISKAVVAMNDPRHQVELLRFKPRAKIPKHTHEGNEFTLVLDGLFSDKAGVYKSGAFIVTDSTVEHQPIAGDEGCICLAITDAPLKFTGTFGPLVNWWVNK